MDEKIFGPRSGPADRAQRGPYVLTESQIFPRPARPHQSISISSYDHFFVKSVKQFARILKFVVRMFTFITHFASTVVKLRRVISQLFKLCTSQVSNERAIDLKCHRVYM